MNIHMMALWKKLISYRKQEWDLDDYPLRVREQANAEEPANGRARIPRFAVDIVNWWLSGTGETVEEARADLAERFTKAKEEKALVGELLPRPGSRVPIEFAEDQKVRLHQDLSQDFVLRVLQLQWAWISDESSLWDFHADESNDVLLARIKDVYGVDVSYIESAKLTDIFERIAEGS
jgi:hypothetical protein